MAETDIKQAAVCFFAGAIAGAAVALLYAPQSGARTQKDIKKFARTTVDRMDDLQSDIRVKVMDWVDDMTEVVKDGVDRGTRLGADGYDQVIKGFDNAMKCVEEGKARFEQLVKTT